MNRIIKNSLFLLFVFAVCLGAAESPLPRVVSLSPAMTELVCHLGRRECLIGRSEVCDFPVEVRKLPVAGRFSAPFVEKVIAMKPDLIITNDLLNSGCIRTFQALGIRTIVRHCRTLKEYRSCVELLGKELHAEKAAKEEIAKVDKLLSAPIPDLGMKVLWVVWDNPVFAPGANSMPDEILRLSGVSNLTGGFKQEYFRCSFDWIFAHSPDAVIWTAAPHAWKKRAVWQKLPAVLKSRVIDDINPDTLQRPGPRMIDAIRMLRFRLAWIKAEIIKYEK